MMFNVDNSGGKAVLSLMNRHGYELFSDLGGYPIRGMVEEAGIGYVVSGPRFYTVANDGTSAYKGALLTNSGNVGMASNGFEICIVDGANGYLYDIAAGTLSAIASGFGGGDTVTFIDQYFVVSRPSTGIAQHSGLVDGTAWNALDVATAEGDPDNLIAVKAIPGQLLLMGNLTTEPYYNAQFPQGFVFGRTGQGYVNMGLAARWSAQIIESSVYCLAKNSEGVYGILRSSGGAPQKISTPALDYKISQYATISDAIAWTFTDEGHSYYVITFPTGNATWVYDVSAAMWSEWRSSGLVRFKASYHMSLNNKHIIGDSTTGKLYRLTLDKYDDNGDKVDKIRTTQYIHQTGQEITWNSLWLDIEVGQGMTGGQGEDPYMIMQYSDDGGKTWSDERMASLGKLGEYVTQVKWNRLGSAPNGRAFKFTVTDSIKLVIIGASADIEVLNG